MATAAATAIRQHQAAERIAAAARRLGLEPADLRDRGRNAGEHLAQILEKCAGMLEQAADKAEQPAQDDPAQDEPAQQRRRPAP